MKIYKSSNFSEVHKHSSFWFSVLGFFAMLLDFLEQVFDYLPGHVLEKIPHASEVGMVLFLLVIFGKFTRFVFNKGDSDGQ